MYVYFRRHTSWWFFMTDGVVQQGQIKIRSKIQTQYSRFSHMPYSPILRYMPLCRNSHPDKKIRHHIPKPTSKFEVVLTSWLTTQGELQTIIRVRVSTVVVEIKEEKNPTRLHNVIVSTYSTTILHLLSTCMFFASTNYFPSQLGISTSLLTSQVEVELHEITIIKSHPKSTAIEDKSL